MPCQFHQCMGIRCNNGNYCNFYQCLLWSSTPGLIWKQLSFVVLVGPLLPSFDNRCAASFHCHNHNPLFCWLYVTTTTTHPLSLNTYFASICLLSRGSCPHVAFELIKWLGYIFGSSGCLQCIAVFVFLISGHQFHAIFCVKSCDKKDPDLPAFVVSRPLPGRYDEAAPKCAPPSTIYSVQYIILCRFRSPSNS